MLFLIKNWENKRLTTALKVQIKYENIYIYEYVQIFFASLLSFKMLWIILLSKAFRFSLVTASV